MAAEQKAAELRSCQAEEMQAGSPWHDTGEGILSVVQYYLAAGRTISGSSDTLAKREVKPFSFPQFCFPFDPMTLFCPIPSIF